MGEKKGLVSITGWLGRGSFEKKNPCTETRIALGESAEGAKNACDTLDAGTGLWFGKVRLKPSGGIMQEC